MTSIWHLGTWVLGVCARGELHVGEALRLKVDMVLSCISRLYRWMVVSPHRGTPLETQKCYSPYSRDAHRGAH